MRRFASTLLTACLVLQAACLVCGKDETLLRRRSQEAQHAGSSSFQGQVTRQESSSKQQQQQQQILTQPQRNATKEVETQTTLSGSLQSEEVGGGRGAIPLDRSTNLMASTGSLLNSLPQRLPNTLQQTSETTTGQVSRLQQGQQGSFTGQQQQQQQREVEPEQVSSQETPAGLRGSSQSGSPGKKTKMMASSAIKTRNSKIEAPLVSVEESSRGISSIQQPIEQQQQALSTVFTRKSGSTGFIDTTTLEPNTRGRTVDQALSVGEMQSGMVPHSQQPIEQQQQALSAVSTRTSGSTGSTDATTLEPNIRGRTVDQSFSVGEMQSDIVPHSQSSDANQALSTGMQGMKSTPRGSVSSRTPQGTTPDQQVSSETKVQVSQSRAKNEIVGDTSLDESGATMLGLPVSAVASRFSSAYPDHVEGYVAGATSSKTGPITSSSGSSLLKMPSSSSATKLDSGISQSKHGKFNTQEEAAECKPLEPQKRQVTPTWLTSFPGSGSRMAWKLIEAITGLYTGDDLDIAGHIESGVAVAVKTHYPSHTDAKLFNQEKLAGISRSVLLLRNPMDAIPALYRFVYFVEEKHERTSSSAAPPSNAWVSWRNQYFDRELQLWMEHTQWWLANYPRENVHLVPFESLFSPERGSNELQKLGNFLGSADPNIAASLLAPDKFCCVWEKLVSQDEFDTSSEKTPPYTADQLEAIIQGLIALRDNNESFPEFFALMDEYLGEIVETKKEIVSMSRNTRETQL